MAIKLVRFTRGRVRAQCNEALDSLLSILNYDSKQPPGTFLTSQQRADMQTTVTDLRTLLQATRAR
jgi:hypothetical protein